MSDRNRVIGKIISKFDELMNLKEYIFLNRELKSYQGKFLLGEEKGTFLFKTEIEMNKFIEKFDSLSDSIFYGIIQQYPLNDPIAQTTLVKIYEKCYELLMFFISLIKNPDERQEFFDTYQTRKFLILMDELIQKLNMEVSDFYEEPEEQLVYEGAVESVNNVNNYDLRLLPHGMPYVEHTLLLKPNMDNSNKISLIIKEHKEKYEAQQERERRERERRVRERQERLRERRRDNQPRGTPLNGKARTGSNRKRANNLRSRRAANRSRANRSANSRSATRSGTSF